MHWWHFNKQGLSEVGDSTAVLALPCHLQNIYASAGLSMHWRHTKVQGLSEVGDSACALAKIATSQGVNFAAVLIPQRTGTAWWLVT